MIVVSDTTAITTLVKADEARFLQALFGRVTIPQAVWDELMEFHSGLPDFVFLCPVADARQRFPETLSPGRGEVEAIQLARELNADLLLTDDRKAAQAAAGLGIQCAGLLGLVVRARQTGQILSAQDFIEKLEKRGGLYLSDAAKAEALRLAGESV
jgi:uncharacterized protein